MPNATTNWGSYLAAARRKIEIAAFHLDQLSTALAMAEPTGPLPSIPVQAHFEGVVVSSMHLGSDKLVRAATLVAFAQQNFGALAEHTAVRDPRGRGQTGSNDSLAANRPPRPGLPTWVRERTVEQELPSAREYPWRDRGPDPLQQPPPDASALGADALAFYAPFHFYRRGWGIFIRSSGVAYVAGVL